ncbi:MAG: replication-relaxation family protein [Anaerolineales bacterium]|nr:replication-relaxation family protein [Anaerolineales bacterium]
MLRSESGLRQGEFEAAVRLAIRYRLVAPAMVRGLGRAPARYGLTPGGADREGMAYSEPGQQRTLLAALKLDYARALLNQWHGAPGIVWALSPYDLPAQALRSERQLSPGRRDFVGQAYRSLHLDALVCLRLTPGNYRNVAVLVDPGNLDLDWFFQQFRSAHAWRRRPEFGRDDSTYFPVVVMLTSDQQRLTQIVQQWRETVHSGDWPGPLRITTFDDLGRDCWWNERCQTTVLWGEVVPCARPSRRPGAPDAGWWAHAAPDEVAAKKPVPISKPSTASHSARLTRRELRRLVDIHQAISLKSRELLDRIGQYPLITMEDLAVVMAFSERHVRDGIEELMVHHLIEVAPSGSGYVLTWLGLCLLAAQVRLPPVEYARLRGWPLRRTATGPEYAVGWFDTVRAHTSLVLDFLVGLCRHGPPRLSLRRWDHVQCLFELPERDMPGQALRRKQLRAVVPDATGVVSVAANSGSRCELAFWLEVDRDTAHGQALADKLARYYRLGGTWDGLAGNLPRLLILVERGGEGRLQALRRRLRGLNEQYQTQLDVRLARADLLGDEHGRLDPVKPAWRTVYMSEFVGAFEG